MILPILILSSIYIAIAFLVNQHNAKYLLSGYNTMFEEKRQNFDIKSYVSYFRKFHVFLGTTLLVISLLLFYFVNQNLSMIFMVLYPLFAYAFFIWKGIRFAKEKNKKQNSTVYIGISIMVSLIIIIAYAININLADNDIKVNNISIEITGTYGTKISIHNLKSIELLNKLPEISSKSNGFALVTIKKGYFTTINGEKIKLLINSDKTPIILMTMTDNQKIYYSSKNKSNEKIYREMKGKIDEILKKHSVKSNETTI